MATQTIIQVCKKYIEDNDIDYLQQIYKDIACEKDGAYDWAFIFQKLYLHACLKKKREVAEWFEKEVFLLLDPIQQIALRQCFAYGRYLLGRKV